MGAGGRWAASTGSVDKSPEIDWMQERLDTYIQTDPLKAWMRRCTLRAEEEAGGALNVVTKTYVLQDKVCVSMTALLLLGLLYTAICSTGRLIVLQKGLWLLRTVCVCVCVLSISLTVWGRPGKRFHIWAVKSWWSELLISSHVLITYCWLMCLLDLIKWHGCSLNIDDWV